MSVPSPIRRGESEWKIEFMNDFVPTVEWDIGQRALVSVHGLRLR